MRKIRIIQIKGKLYRIDCAVGEGKQERFMRAEVIGKKFKKSRLRNLFQRYTGKTMKRHEHHSTICNAKE